MTTWTGLYNSQATYISNIIDVSSDFEYYINDVILDYENNDGVVKVEIRVTHDGFEWSEWTDVSLFLDNMFYIDGIRMNFTSIQYKVTMDIHSMSTSPVFKSFGLDLYGAFKIFNTGDEICKPEIWIRKNGSGDVLLQNKTNGQVLEFTGLNDGETVYVDCDNKDIMSDLPLTYRYKNHNGLFLELEIGENVITGHGDFDLEIRCEFKVLQ